MNTINGDIVIATNPLNFGWAFTLLFELTVYEQFKNSFQTGLF